MSNNLKCSNSEDDKNQGYEDVVKQYFDELDEYELYKYELYKYELNDDAQWELGNRVKFTVSM